MLLLKKISEYEILEKYFGLTKDDEINVTDKKDAKMTINNLKEDKEYSNFSSFLEWVNNKSKKELLKELSKLEDKIEKEKKHISKIIPSSEQQTIIDCVKKCKNVSVDAVAGSGKTTTVLFIALNNPKKKILQITYNKQLKFEVREKAELYNIDNLEIHTYHSLAVKNYDKDAHTDDKIIKVLSDNKPPKHKKKYEIIIVDEVQDMTPNYYFLVNKFINDMGLSNSIIVILGDRYQGIYEFKNADTRFLVFANQIWKNKNDFINLPMQESYRVTKQISTFVNKVMLGSNRIISNKKSDYKVQYYKKNKFMIHVIFAKKILEYLGKGYKPSDIFVLSPSIKSTNNPVKKLENKLVEANIPVYFSRMDEEGLDEDVIKGKIAFTTFHQAKGRERKIVFVFGFDDSYFKYHGKDKDQSICPSELYVAITRASEILVVLDSEDCNMLPFLKYSYQDLKYSKFVDYYGDVPKTKIEKKEKEIADDYHKTTVKDLTTYISEENNEKLIELLNTIYSVSKEPSTKYTADIPCIIKTSDGKTEDVSDINGIVIPAMYEHKKYSKCSLEEIIKKMYSTSDTHTMKFIDTNYEKLTKQFSENPISSFLYMGNLYIALTENIHSKLNQIDKYEWLSKELIHICHKNLKRFIGIDIEYEKDIGNQHDGKGLNYYEYKSNSYGTIDIYGRIDAVDTDTLWEFKCVSNITNEHLLQLVVYSWIWNKCMKENNGSKTFKILNIRTGELRKMKYENYIVEEIISILFNNKYAKKPKIDDNTFIEKCNVLKDKIKNTNKPIEKSLFQIFEKNTSTYNPSKILDDDVEDYVSDDEPVKMSFNIFK